MKRVLAATLTLAFMGGVGHAGALDDLDARLAALQSENAALKKLARIEALERENAALRKQVGASAAPETPARVSGIKSEGETYTAYAAARPQTRAIPAVPTAIYSKAPAYIPEPTPVADRWAGGYVGAHAGVGAGRWPLNDSYTSAVTCTNCLPNYTISGNTTGATNLNPVSAFGGIHAGYLWSYNSLLFGPEGDISFGAIKQNKPLTFAQRSSVMPPIFTPSTSFGLTTGEASAGVDWVATARGRVGAEFGNLLVFGTGGLAVAQFDLNTFSSGTHYANTEYAVGYAAGGGIEMGVGSNVGLRLEYMYLGFPSQSVAVSIPVPSGFVFQTGSQTAVASVAPSTHTVRAGVDWHFH